MVKNSMGSASLAINPNLLLLSVNSVGAREYFRVYFLKAFSSLFWLVYISSESLILSISKIVWKGYVKKERVHSGGGFSQVPEHHRDSEPGPEPSLEGIVKFFHIDL